MEELRFRAWDKFNGCFYYSDDENNLADFFAKVQYAIDGGNELIINRAIPYANGKYVYDGDIIQSSYGYNGIVEHDAFIYHKIDCTVDENLIIIGNIFENPNILN